MQGDKSAGQGTGTRTSEVVCCPTAPQRYVRHRHFHQPQRLQCNVQVNLISCFSSCCIPLALLRRWSRNLVYPLARHGHAICHLMLCDILSTVTTTTTWQHPLLFVSMHHNTQELFRATDNTDRQHMKDTLLRTWMSPFAPSPDRAAKA
jgi:hypothetical protein